MIIRCRHIGPCGVFERVAHPLPPADVGARRCYRGPFRCLVELGKVLERVVVLLPEPHGVERRGRFSAFAVDGESGVVGRLAGRPGVDDVVGGHACGRGRLVAEHHGALGVGLGGHPLEQVAACRERVDYGGAHYLDRGAGVGRVGHVVGGLCPVVDAGGHALEPHRDFGGIFFSGRRQVGRGVGCRGHHEVGVCARRSLPRLLVNMVAHGPEGAVGGVLPPLHRAGVGHNDHVVVATAHIYQHGGRRI